jgi:hypothetical protein
MSGTQTAIVSPVDLVEVTLKLDASVYQSFLQKAQKAGVDIEPFLSSTLAIVLGCRVFNENYACSQQLAGAARLLSDTKKPA